MYNENKHKIYNDSGPTT